MKHKIGDRVRVNCPGSVINGLETTIVSGPHFDEVYDCNGLPLECLNYVIDHPRIHGFAPAFEPHELIPIYDGNEKTSWEDMKEIWSPLEVVQ